MKDYCDPGYQDSWRTETIFTNVNRVEESMKKLLLLTFIVSIVAGCAWENEETLYPDLIICDTLNASYLEGVVPILSANCYGCHSNANAPDFATGIAFQDYEDVVASSDLIVGAINHREGFPAMPKEADKLDTCSIKIIETWVNSGTPEN